MQDLRINSILSLPLTAARAAKTQGDEASKESFSSLLEAELGAPDGIKFSKHAQSRLESRNISLASGDLEKLSAAVDRAAGKGVSDSLVLMNNLAFIVSVPDRTVVTAMPVGEAEQSVFTNIDGAVIA